MTLTNELAMSGLPMAPLAPATKIFIAFLLDEAALQPRGDSAGTPCYRLLIPPSISNWLPTVNADSSEAKKTTALAISEEFPNLPAGTRPRMEAPNSLS